MLIFFILALVILSVLFNCIGINSRMNKLDRMYASVLRKTNAKLEQYTLDQYLKRGKPFDEAYELTKTDMIQKGYVPCIPLKAYRRTPYSYSSIVQGNKDKDAGAKDWDSDAVKFRRARFDINREKYYDPRIDETFIYQDFPQNRWEYDAELNIYAHGYKK